MSHMSRKPFIKIIFVCFLSLLLCGGILGQASAAGTKGDAERLKALEVEVKTLKARVQILEDTEEIYKLQRIYGYYLDNELYDQIVDLFADQTESVEIGARGVYKGKKGAETLFAKVMGRGNKSRPYGVLRNHMQLQGVVHVDPDGKTAQGRWRAWIQTGTWEKPETASWGEGTYEMDYVKENGKWKFKKLLFVPVFYTPFRDGWTVKSTIGPPASKELPPDAPPTFHESFPSTYYVPYHYKNPVTGR